MRKIIIFLLIIIALGTVGFFIYRGFVGDKGKEVPLIETEGAREGKVMQFTTPSE